MRKFYLIFFLILGFISSGKGQSLTVNPTTLDFGNVCVNSNSAIQSFIISGTTTNNNDILIAALGGYSYSLTSNGIFSPNLTIHQTAGSLSQQVFIRFTPANSLGYNGQVSISGGGLPDATLAVSGSGSAINAVSVNTVDVSSTTVCQGTAINFTAHPTGSNLTYQWQIDGFNVNGETNSTFQTSTLKDGNVVSVIVRSSAACTTGSPATSSGVTINVDPPTVAGSVSGGGSVCSGTNSTLLTLGAHTGTIVRWEKSTDNFTTSTTIANTNDTYTATNLSATTSYRAVVKSGVCGEIASTPTTINVDPPTVAGSVSGGGSVCSGTNSTLLTLGAHTGTIVRWEKSTDNFTTSTTIANANDTYTATNLSATTSYRAVVKSGVCGEIASTPTTINVDPPTVAGSVSGGGSVCSGTNSTLLTLGAHTGTIVRWEKSTDNFTTSTTIANTNDTYTATNLSATTSYRAVVKSGVCGEIASTPTTINVDPPTVAGSVSGGGSVCSGTNSTLLTLGAHTGTIVRWEKSTDNFTTSTTIANTNDTYTATNLSATTSYRAVVKSGVCGEIASTPTTINVDPPTVAGSVSGGGSVCSGTNSTLLTLGAHTGTIVRWEKSTDNFTTSTTIANTNDTYTATNLSATTSYRAVVKSGVCGEIVSTPTTINVDPPTVAGSVSGGGSVCSGTNSTLLTLGAHTGTIVRWEKSTDNFTTSTTIANTNDTYTATNLSATTSYRAVVKSGVCGEIASTPTTINVDPPTVAGSVSGGGSVCSGTNSTLLTLGAHTGTIVRWEKSTDNFATSTSIANTNDTYTATNLSATTSYRAVVKSGVCGEMASTPTTINVDPVPAVSVSITASSTSICTTAHSGSTPVIFTATPINGGTNPTYQWMNNGAPISNETGSTYTAPSLTTGSNISVVMTSNATCASSTGVPSNAIGMTSYYSASPSPPVFAQSTTSINATPICPPETGLIYAVNSDPNVTNYTWSMPSDWGSITSGQGTNQITINETKLVEDKFTLTVTGKNVCGSSSQSMDISVLKSASVYAGADASICAADSYSLNDAAIGGYIKTNAANALVWTASKPGTFTPDNNSLNPTFKPNASVTGSIILTLQSTKSPSNQSCKSLTSTMNLTVYGPPTAVAGTAVATCSNSQPVNITDGSSATNYSKITWTSNGTGNFANANSLTTATYTPSADDITAGSVTLTLTATGKGTCGDATSTKTLTITSAPTAVAGTAIATCSNSQPVNITDGSSATNYSKITWTSNGTGNFANANSLTTATYTPSADDITAGSVTLTLTATGKGTCGDATSTKTLTITSAPTAVAGTAVATCSNSQPVNITDGSSATNYSKITWTSNGTGNFANANSLTTATYTPSADDITAGSVTLTLTATGKGTCGDATSTKTLTITSAPTAVAGTAIATCSNSQPVNITDGSSATNYSKITWTSNGTGNFANANSLTTATYTPSADDITAGSVTLTLTATGKGTCGDATSTKTLTITSAPTAVAGTAIATCSNSQPVNITDGSSATNYSKITWTSNGTGNFANANSLTTATYTPSADDITAGSVTLTLTATGKGTCGDATSTKTLTITSAPTAVAGTAIATCSNSQPVNITDGSSATNYSKITWTSNGTGNFANANSLTTATYTPSADDITAGSVTLTLTATGKGTCGDATSTKTLTITSAPTAVAGTAIATCSNSQPVNITDGSSATNYSKITWTSNGTGNFANANSLTTATYTPSADDITAGSVTLTLTATGKGTCGDATSTKTLTITSAPTAVAGTAIATCSNSQPVNITDGSSATNYTIVKWTSTGTGTIANDNSLTNATYTPGNNEIGTLTLTLTVSGNSPCSTAISTKSLTINQEVKIKTLPQDDVVCASFGASFSVEATGTGLTFQWQKNGADIPGAKSSTYSISHALYADDKSVYTVKVGGAEGCSPVMSNPGAVLTVNQINSVTDPSDKEVCNNISSVSFSVSTDATDPAFSWRKDGHPIDDGGNISGTKTEELKIDNPTSANEGNYDVIVSVAGTGCTQIQSNPAVLSMDPVTVPGSVSADQEICNGNSPEDISLTGTVGKVLNWQSSSNVNFTSLNDIDGTSTTLAGTAIGGLTNTTYFRAVVQSGVCDIKYSDPVKVSINSLPTPTISGPASACLNVPEVHIQHRQGCQIMCGLSLVALLQQEVNQQATTTVTWTSTGAKSISVNYADGNTCTAASPFTYNVTVNSLPTSTISGPASACLNVPEVHIQHRQGCQIMCGLSPVVLLQQEEKSTDVTATVTWTSTGAKSISVNYADGNACTAASPFTYNVTVNSLPTPTISGPASACLNVPGSTYSTQAGMSNYVWSVTGGTITEEVNQQMLQQQ